MHWFVLTNPLLFAQQPPQGLFPSLGAMGSVLVAGRDRSSRAQAGIAALLCEQPRLSRLLVAQVCQGSGLNPAPGTAEVQWELSSP